MKLKGTKLYSIFWLKCPRCHEGDLFVNKNPYRFKGFFDMPKQCPVCQQKYEIEPGFYYGAMYVSYAVCIALSVAVFVMQYYLLNISLFQYLILDAVLLILLLPYIFKISRAIWINFFVHYRGSEN